MNCECLNALYHQPNGKKVFCDVDSSYRLAGNGLVEIKKEKNILYFGAHFENGIAAGTGFVCVSTNVEQIAGIRFENDRIVAVNDQFATERAIVDEDTGRRWEGWIDQYHIPCGFGRFYDDDGNLEYEGLCWEGQRCGFGVTYHTNGYIASSSFYVFNKKFGFSKDYDRQGRYYRNGFYCNDIICVDWGINQAISDGKETAYCSATSLVENLAVTDLSLIHSCFFRLKSLTICEHSIPSNPHLVVSYLPSLSRIHFLPSACSHYTNDYPPYLHLPEIQKTSKTLEITKCPALARIRFDSFACSDFSSLIINLSSLEECIFGEEESYCFYAATSLQLRSPRLRMLRFGEFSFYWTEVVQIESGDYFPQ